MRRTYAISDHRIISVDHNDQVLFRYTDTRSGVEKTISLSPFEFIRRFLQHVLPTGFMKIRYYGFMHASTNIPVKVTVVFRHSTEVSADPCILPFQLPAMQRHNEIRRVHSARTIAIAAGFT